MGRLIDIEVSENTVVLTLLRLISIGVSGEIDDEYYTTALHLGLWKLEMTTAISWRK